MERSLSMTSYLSTLSTPDLSPYISESESSTDSASFFSAVSSTDDLRDVLVTTPLSVDFPSIPVKPSPFRGRQPAPIPFPAPHHPRKLRKAKRRDSSSRPVEITRSCAGYEPLGRRERSGQTFSFGMPFVSHPLNKDEIGSRRVKFQTSAERNLVRSPQRHRARSPYPRSSASIELEASGDPFLSSMSIPHRSTRSLSGALEGCNEETRALLGSISRQSRDATKAHRRHWTIGLAIDDCISDELDEIHPVEKMSLSSPEMTLFPCLSDQSARILLICRELVRTEWHYLVGLRTLASSETHTPPPPLMLAYLPALLQVSATLLTRMTTLGVAMAFLSVEEELEAAMIGWSGVVGGFFVERDTYANKETRRNSLRRLRRRINSLTSSAPSKTRMACPTVRDLAILPTQRVVRYTLLFKDLYSHMPSSNASVEKAVQTAISIARKCDRAQDNAAFLR